jgi:prevent-host-death family protein
MRLVPAAEAKAGFSELLDSVASGETVVITRHGKPVAEIRSTEEALMERRRKAVEEIMAFRARMPKVSIEEILSARDEGRRY